MSSLDRLAPCHLLTVCQETELARLTGRALTWELDNATVLDRRLSALTTPDIRCPADRFAQSFDRPCLLCVLTSEPLSPGCLRHQTSVRSPAPLTLTHLFLSFVVARPTVPSHSGDTVGTSPMMSPGAHGARNVRDRLPVSPSQATRQRLHAGDPAMSRRGCRTSRPQPSVNRLRYSSLRSPRAQFAFTHPFAVAVTGCLMLS